MNKRHFRPLFVTQFLGAFNDNFFKTALVVMIAYGLIDIGTMRAEILVTVAAAVFIIPFALCAPLGGNLADKFDKSAVIRHLKLAEIILVFAAILGLWLGSIKFLIFVLFGFGVQSALFNPSKFSILPIHLDDDALIGANALLNTGTFLAILLGNIFATVLIVNEIGQIYSIIVMALFSCAGYWASRFIPSAPAACKTLKINFNLVQEAWHIVKYVFRLRNGMFTAMICNAVFFFIGGLYLSQLPNYTSQILGVDSVVLAFLLAVFSIGVGFGGLLNNMILRSEVRATFVPWASLAIALFSLDLFFVSKSYDASFDLKNLNVFLFDVDGLHITFDFLALAVCGGLYSVPLKTTLQHRAPHDHLARVMAASATMDALFILASSLCAIILFSLGFEIYHLFIVVCGLALFVTFYSAKLNS